MTQKIIKATESTAFLIGEIVFCLAFLSVCEIPNWTRGPYETNHCVDRWMFVAGLFMPSGIQSALQGYNGRSRSSSGPRKDPGTI
jgi:hypothetical protein